MVEPANPNDPGASGGPEAAPIPAPATPKAEPKFEVKDGSYLVDGKKMVTESDLIAAKKSLETQLETQQSVHVQAIDTAKLELSAEQQKVADLNAKLTEAEQARQAGTPSDEEVVRIKQELTDALGKVETLTTEAGRSLELRRALLVMQYNVPADSLADKDMKALDSFEEALKALATSRGGGAGPYALGGGVGGAAPQTPIDRAKEVLAGTPVLGVRSAEPTPK